MTSCSVFLQLWANYAKLCVLSALLHSKLIPDHKQPLYTLEIHSIYRKCQPHIVRKIIMLWQDFGKVHTWQKGLLKNGIINGLLNKQILSWNSYPSFNDHKGLFNFNFEPHYTRRRRFEKKYCTVQVTILNSLKNGQVWSMKLIKDPIRTYQISFNCAPSFCLPLQPLRL